MMPSFGDHQVSPGGSWKKNLARQLGNRGVSTEITPPAGCTTFERVLLVKRARSVSDMIGANFEHPSTDLGFQHQNQRDSFQ